MTLPAADGGLPGPLLQRLCDISKTDHARGCQGRQYSCDCGWDGRTMDTAEEAFAWINAQAARLAEKDAELVALGQEAFTLRNRLTDARKDATNWQRLHDEKDERTETAEAQLATATERLASAAKLIANARGLLSQPPTRKEYPRQEDYIAWADAARAWLTSKDGEKQP